ncbi:MAG: hypothetical protein R3E88_06880 [Myxococcota bacterium]|nr:hypothetical protein [Myxococcales bacterium]
MPSVLAAAHSPADLANVSDASLPYGFSEIFTGEGFFARRLDRKRLKLIQSIDDALRGLLANGERVEAVTWGVEYSFVDHYFMGAWAYLVNRRAVVLTSQRIVLLQIDGRGRARELRSEVRYAAIASVVKRRLGYLVLTLNDGRKLTLTGVPRRDRGALRERLEAHVRASRTEPRVSGRSNLCPHCGVRVREFPERCRQCGRGFKSAARAGWLSLAFPGLGDLYLGHRLLGAVEIAGGVGAWLVVGLAAVQIHAEDPSSSLAATAVLATVVFAFVHGVDAVITRRMGFKGIYPASDA